jgi:hypothetical protein
MRAREARSGVMDLHELTLFLRGRAARTSERRPVGIRRRVVPVRDRRRPGLLSARAWRRRACSGVGQHGVKRAELALRGYFDMKLEIQAGRQRLVAISNVVCCNRARLQRRHGCCGGFLYNMSVVYRISTSTSPWPLTVARVHPPFDCQHPGDAQPLHCNEPANVDAGRVGIGRDEMDRGRRGSHPTS